MSSCYNVSSLVSIPSQIGCNSVRSHFSMLKLSPLNSQTFKRSVFAPNIRASVLIPSQIGCNSVRSHFSMLKLSPLNSQTFKRSVFAPNIRASSTAFVKSKPDLDNEEMKLNIRQNILACPICHEPVVWNSKNPGLSLESAAQSSLQCNTCRKTYFGNETHLDVTITAAPEGYGESKAVSTEFFRFPLISFLYERGWRQCFSLLGGFPGPEKEFEMIKHHLKPVLGGNIIDASCGSGLFSRLFAKSGLFSLVVALDFSETMMQQCYEFIKQDKNFPQENIILVRADISRLPFGSCSVDAVHAGAALHCWPSPSAAMAEISRVLKPGGIFVATTFIFDVPLPLRQNIARILGGNSFLSEQELEHLCTTCGLVNFTCTRNRTFVMLSAAKPE